MNNSKSHKSEAIRYMKLSDHLLTMTYPLVEDPKLLKVVLKNLFLSIKHALSAFYENERLGYKTDNFNILLDRCRKKFKKYNISMGYVEYIKKMYNLLYNNKKADVEFIRKDKFVFSTDNYKLNIISKKEMKDYIIKGKLFLKEILGVIK
jgi:hypothetical protein